MNNMNIIRLQGDSEKRRGLYYEYDADAVPLGEGGMGRVFKGFRVVEKTGERTPVAIKAIYDNIPERVVERARREASIQIESDNLIRMLGFVETETFYGEGKRKVHYHVIMELLVGVTLEDILKGITMNQNSLQIPFAAELYNQYLQDRDAAVVRIMRSILLGLMALHDNGYIHRDIDPSNIMVTMDGKIKLIDFGICKQIVSLESLDKALTASGVFMGKVNYAAPELVLGDVKNQNYTTDIYALGVLMYQLCTGHLPFSGTDQDILSANLRKKLPLKDVKNGTIRKIISKATEKIQAKRYSSVAELRVELDKVIPNRGHKTDYKLYRMAGLVMLSVALGIGMFFFIQNLPKEENQVVVSAPTCDELYHQALAWVERKDSAQLREKGWEQMKVLVDDSLYQPAKLKYYTYLINSNNPDKVQRGFYGIKNLVIEEPENSVAQFECGLTLSKGNRYFNVPTVRQSMLNINPDLSEANEWLYRSLGNDSTNYKSAYWIFNNLMEEKLAGTIRTEEDKQITVMYHLFMNLVTGSEDETTERYINAIKGDKETLRAWGLIR